VTSDGQLSAPNDAPASLKFGLRQTQIATGVLLLTLLAALGISAFMNASARDREVDYLQVVETTTSQLINTQRAAIVLVENIDGWATADTAPALVSGAVNGLESQIQLSIESDRTLKDLVSPAFAQSLSAVKAAAATGVRRPDENVAAQRNLILRESRSWLTTYQVSAVSKLRSLSQVRAVNERNQAILLLTSLSLSAWLLLWVAMGVANTYRSAKVIIEAEESKVQSARSALKHASDQLSYQATHDALTGLPNRVALMERLNRVTHDHPESQVTVFFCDLDRFKVVNDSLGHAMGDELLVEAATRLAKTIKDEDFVARFGGDEFVVVCNDIEDRAGALRVAERISRSLSRPFDMHGQDAFVGVSVGIAFSHKDSTANQLLRDADVAMYRAKAMPSVNHIEFFDASGDQFSYRFDTENALRRAITSNQLLLHWQPIVNLKTAAVHTLEALVRWERPGSGLLMPAEFMHIAEDSGLIIQLGRWVLGAACSAGALTDDRSVAVNISVQQLRDPNFVDDLREILSETGLPAERLIVEITEHSMIDSAVLSAPLRRVRELGVRVALDDFGTGYSSLGLLPRLPIDIIKLDRSFLRDITSSDESQAIIKSLVQLAAALNVMLIVEGVESDAQRKILRSLGVQHGQGYWFGQPEPGRLVGTHVRR